MLSALPHMGSSRRLHLCPLLAAGFTLAFIWVWMPRQTKLAQKHTFDSPFFKQDHMMSFGRVTRASRHHQYELPKEVFHHMPWKDLFVFPQLLLTDISSLILNYQK